VVVERVGHDASRRARHDSEVAVHRLLHIDDDRRITMSWMFIVLVLLVVLAVFPAWPYSRGWGYGPMGLASTALLVLLVLVLMGKL
jgi:hypothetical protein